MPDLKEDTTQHQQIKSWVQIAKFFYWLDWKIYSQSASTLLKPTASLNLFVCFACTQTHTSANTSAHTRRSLSACFIILCTDITDGIILWSDTTAEHLPTFIILLLSSRFYNYSCNGLEHGPKWLIYFFFSITLLKSNSSFCSPSQTPDASWLEQIFSLARQSWQIWWFVILSFTHLAVPRYFTPKYTEIKQLLHSASAIVILTGASGTENLISQHWQIKEANLYLSEMFFFLLFFIYRLYFLSSLHLVCNF